MQHVIEWMINHKVGKNNCYSCWYKFPFRRSISYVFDDINLMKFSGNADQKSIYNSAPRSFLTIPLFVLGNRSVHVYLSF